jgi:acyl transferase domain-containing protein
LKWETFPLRGPSIYEELQSKEAPTSGAQLQAQKQGGRAEKVDVEGVVKEVLGMGADDVLDLDAPMQDLGFDSMMSVELSHASLSRNRLEVRVSATVAYDYPSVRQLKEFIDEELRRGRDGESAAPVVSRVGAGAGERVLEAVVSGAACRYGTAWNANELWRLLANGSDEIREIPSQRWSWESQSKAMEGKSVSKWGGFVEKIDVFDAAFFGVSPREAKGMDPQHRMLLECAWEAMEDAGQDLNRLKEDRAVVNVYVGIQDLRVSGSVLMKGESADGFSATGTTLSIAAGRISYILGWTGEAMSIDTACSSSLVALVQGCRGVERGEAPMALCCGVNAMFDGYVFLVLSNAGMLSPDGRCKTFDASANGYGRGEGCGALVVRGWKSGGVDGGTAMGRVRGYAVNQDGRSNGLTAPNGPSQVRLIRDALSMGALEGADVTMLEAHGTGTSLGDPIEVQALSEAIGSRGARNGLVLSSAKTNFGHTETAAGVLGVSKVLLSFLSNFGFQHLHLQTLNGFIGASLLEGMRAVVPVEAIEWKGEKKVAGVSSFGFSGTNAHVILEQVAVKRESEKEKLSTFVARASGRTAEAVQLLSKVYAAAFAECELASWLSVASVSQRSVFATGLVVVGSTAKEVAKLLREASEEEGKVVLGKEVMVVGESASGKEEEALAAARGAAAEGGTRAELPTYQFSRKVYWVDERKQQQQQGGNFKVFGQKVFVDEGTEAFLANAGLIRSWYAVEDHVVYGALVMPGAAHLTAVMEQKKEGRTSGEVVLRRVELRVPVVVEEEVVVQYVHHAKDGKFEVRSSGSEGSWKLHVVGEAEYRSADGLAEMLSVERRQQGGRPVEAAEFWDTMQGVKFGPSFRWLEKFRPEGEDRRVALCWLRAPENWTSSVFGMPAEVIDSMFQAVNFVSLRTLARDVKFLSPFAMDEVTLRLERGFEQHSEDMVSETRFVSGTERTVRLDARLYQDGVSVLGIARADFGGSVGGGVFGTGRGPGSTNAGSDV